MDGRGLVGVGGVGLGWFGRRGGREGVGWDGGKGGTYAELGSADARKDDPADARC